MKICLLAPANNYHTKKWCEYFINRGYEVEVISFIKSKINGVKIHFIDSGASANDSDLKKIKYLFKVDVVKKIIKQIKPDIINAHFATSYGMVAALAVPNKFICSVWGTDVYTFPKKSFIHKKYFEYILKKSKYIFSTSKSMAEEIKKYSSKNVFVTPFGVKMDLFNPNKRFKNNEKELVVGTVKALESRYGINYLIDAVSIINNERPDINIKLRVAGEGSKDKEYRDLAIQKNVKVEWLGYISQELVAYELANLDIAIFSSVCLESFGVSVIEAQACGTPVIVSNTPGFLETTIPNETSIVVEKGYSKNIANAIIELYDNPQKRKTMGKNGRKYVLQNYEYNSCFKKIEDLFSEGK